MLTIYLYDQYRQRGATIVYTAFHNQLYAIYGYGKQQSSSKSKSSEWRMVELACIDYGVLWRTMCRRAMIFGPIPWSYWLQDIGNTRADRDG